MAISFRARPKPRSLHCSALGSLQGASTEAVDCLRRNLSCGNPNAEVGAARTILDFTMRAKELIHLTEQLNDLERRLAK